VPDGTPELDAVRKTIAGEEFRKLDTAGDSSRDTRGGEIVTLLPDITRGGELHIASKDTFRETSGIGLPSETAEEIGSLKELEAGDFGGHECLTLGGRLILRGGGPNEERQLSVGVVGCLCGVAALCLYGCDRLRAMLLDIASATGWWALSRDSCLSSSGGPSMRMLLCTVFGELILTLFVVFGEEG